MYRFLFISAPLFFGLIPMVFAQAPDFVSQEGLVGWYAFDGDATDAGPLQLDGMTTNVLWTDDRLGQPNAALDLSQPSGDYVDLPSAIDAEFDSTITLSMWVNYPAIPGQKIFDQGPTPGLYDQIGVLIWDVVSSGNMSIRLYTGAGTYASYSYPEEEQWKHLTFVVEGSQFSMYIDGDEVKSGTTLAWNNSIGTVRIGESIFGIDYNYLGVIDDLGLWKRALSPEEVSALYLEQPIVPGCTDSTACNFNMEATSDDGSCAYAGCNDPSACNFNGSDVCTLDCIYPALGEDCSGGDDLCGPGTFWNANTQRCEVLLVGDSDADGCMTVSDLLSMLSMFGLCVDVETQTFACGVDDVTFDGHDYATVQIGEDCWFAENLRTSIYANGDSISEALSDSDWVQFAVAQQPAQCALGYDSLEVVDIRGLWYNAYAAYDERGLCPTGWHVSTEVDWVSLELDLGATSAIYWPDVASGSIDNLLNVVGKAIKSPMFFSDQFATNTSGFGAVPAGAIAGVVNNNYDGDAWFWSTVEGGDNSSKKRRRRVQDVCCYSVKDTDDPGRGMSVRCVQD